MTHDEMLDKAVSMALGTNDRGPVSLVRAYVEKCMDHGKNHPFLEKNWIVCTVRDNYNRLESLERTMATIRKNDAIRFNIQHSASSQHIQPSSDA